MAKKRRFNIRKDLLGGQWLASENMVKQWPFILYVVLLMLLYMGLNQRVISVKRIKNKNTTEIKNLKADLTSKAAKLQNQSSRNQIIEKLQATGSTLKNPSEPAQIILLTKD